MTMKNDAFEHTGGLFWSNCLCGTNFSLIEGGPVAGADCKSKSPRKIDTRAVTAGFIQFRSGESGAKEERTHHRNECNLRYNARLFKLGSHLNRPLFVAKAELAISHAHGAAGRDEE
jgi:hypothetical protein